MNIFEKIHNLKWTFSKGGVPFECIILEASRDSDD